MIKVRKSGIPEFSFYIVADFQPFAMLKISDKCLFAFAEKSGKKQPCLRPKFKFLYEFQPIFN